MPSRITGRVQLAGLSGSQPVSRQRIARASSAIERGKAPGIFTKPSRMKSAIMESSFIAMV